MQETNAAALLEHLAGLLAEQQRQRQELARLAEVEAVSERVHQEILLLVDTLNQHGVELTGAARVVPAAAECIRRQAARLAELETRLDPRRQLFTPAPGAPMASAAPAAPAAPAAGVPRCQYQHVDNRELHGLQGLRHRD